MQPIVCSKVQSATMRQKETRDDHKRKPPLIALFDLVASSFLSFAHHILQIKIFHFLQVKYLKLVNVIYLFGISMKFINFMYFIVFLQCGLYKIFVEHFDF